MFKKALLVMVCCVVIAFAIVFNFEFDRNTQRAQVVEPILRIDTQHNIEPELLDDVLIVEEIEKNEKPAPSPAKPIVKDLSLISAEAYTVGNLETGEIYLEKNPNTIFSIASISKLFTALASLHILDKEKKITITQSMLDAWGDAGNLVLDEQFTVDELIYPLLLESSNDAAEALAQSHGYDIFIDLMNSFAMEIGMNETSFKDSSGLSPANVSNTNNLFTLSRYIYKSEKHLLELMRQKEMTLATTTDHGFHHFVSIHPFSIYEPFMGGKTGRTVSAKESMISLFSYRSKLNPDISVPIVIIVLRSDYEEREIDTEKLLEKLGKII
jgi:D-alanyl-D-alanine carboxypeptidase